ncbi:alpha/beta fold hydrolase [Pseudomonas panipatensis]|uniref:Pimeloyl-ACP methyl ester carboxylesterase n=1 Tax=Pseudomonas panipatensis TaxID=428992 RepID=A0A1G8IMS3_9PSED|nr:alpha/beta hydrolase [Pseudomonas panipatensis]SDI20091.1 Pimeloyl-ACP methyl ester carboxylesterase [Pseudomonas panipatensis]SMP73498.1 Pimeloyl-ACP methyl ester carboxylesterase [Pseudomonas panipatensis]
MLTIEQRLLAVNGIRLNVWLAGPEEGRPLWLLHGFPECWHSWRGQIPALVAAGYRVCVPEMRGYGASDAPVAVEAYDLPSLCGDIRAAMDALGQARAAVIGHDWGAFVAWHLALWEPQRVEALVTLSVPFAGRPRRPATEIMRELHGGRFNYILYFQQPGVAEAELDADLSRSLRLFFRDPGDSDPFLQDKPADARLFDDLPSPARLPAWCSEADFAIYLRTFAGRGFRGALNWYRNFERNWQRSESLAGLKVQQPTLFAIGDRDPVGRLEAYTLSRMADWVPRLEQHRLAACGHWIQNEKTAEVNALLVDFLARHYPA